MDLRVEGAGELVNRLSRFDKEVYKILMREVKGAADTVAAEARRNVEQPLSGWGKWQEVGSRRGARQVGAVSIGAFGGRQLSFDAGAVRSSIKASARKTRARGRGTTGVAGVVRMSDAAGSIFSTAGGAKRRPSTNSLFVRNLRAKWGEEYPRILGPAWRLKGTQAGERIDQALDRAKQAIGL